MQLAGLEQLEWDKIPGNIKRYFWDILIHKFDKLINRL